MTLVKRYAQIIEDDEDLAMLFSEALGAAQFKTEVVRDGYQGLTRVFESVPDILVLDLHLPYVSGGEILHRVRTDPKMEKVLVIIVTADERAAKQFSDQADLVLLKPVSYCQLRDLAMRLCPAA